jgi:DNA-binding transcriptional MerR regulator
MAISGRLPPAVLTESGMRLFRRTDVERLAAERDAQGKRTVQAELRTLEVKAVL